MRQFPALMGWLQPGSNRSQQARSARTALAWTSSRWQFSLTVAGVCVQPHRPDSMRALDEVTAAMSGGSEPLKAADVKAKADDGHTLARLAYGLMLMEGQAGVRQDMQSAADYLRPACAAKNANACFFLGLMHDGLVGVDGRGLPRRPAEVPPCSMEALASPFGSLRS